MFNIDFDHTPIGLVYIYSIHGRIHPHLSEPKSHFLGRFFIAYLTIPAFNGRWPPLSVVS